MKAWLVVALLLVAPAHARETVRIGWLKATNDLALAKAHGTLEKALAADGAGVEWDGPFPAAAPAAEALNAGAIDITVGSSGSLAASLAAGAPVVAFTFQHLGPNGEAILVRAGSPIRTVADLAGRSVAVNRGGTGEYLLVRALQTHGLPLDAARRVYLGPADAASAFASGAFDGWAIWDPFISIALTQYGARVLANGAAIGSDNAVVMLASRDFAAHHARLLRTIYRVLLGENAWSLAHKDAAGAIWARTLGLPTSLGPRLGANDAVPTGPIDAAAAQQVRAVADWYVANKIVPQVPGLDAALLDLGLPGGSSAEPR